MPYRQLRFLLAIGLCASLFASSQFTPVARAATPTFTDVDPNSTSPYAVAIYALAQRGILNGYNDGTGRFGPLDPIIRAQAAAVVVRALGWSGDQGRSNFSDQGTIDNELWNSVRVLADRGVAQGFGDGTYRPTLPVSQVQAVSLITRAMVNKGYWVNQPDADTLYPDVPASSGARTDVVTYDHYVGFVSYANHKGAGGWTKWAQPSDRRGVALIVWNALQNTNPPTVTPPTPGLPPAVAGQPCPTWVHDRYVTQGPDGKLYPTWHPPVDKQYGCTFGHDHGDDPTGAPALQGRTVPFGYVGLSMGEVEAHSGFKIYRWDNVQSSYGPSHNGSSLLIMIHQGSSSDNAFTQPFHEIHFHYVNPNDGRVVHIQMMAPFGNLGVGCGANDPNLLKVQQTTIPGMPPNTTAGMRQIPGPACYGAALKNAPGTVPDSIPYEDWLTALYVGTDGSGNWRAYMDPHFAIFNPNRYCQPNPGFSASAPCTLGRSDVRANDGIDPASTASNYKGTHREAYLNQVWLMNAGKSPTFYTDGHGRLVAPGTMGAIQQYVASMNAKPLVNSTSFGGRVDYDQDGTVHTPN